MARKKTTAKRTKTTKRGRKVAPKSFFSGGSYPTRGRMPRDGPPYIQTQYVEKKREEPEPQSQRQSQQVPPNRLQKVKSHLDDVTAILRSGKNLVDSGRALYDTLPQYPRRTEAATTMYEETATVGTSTEDVQVPVQANSFDDYKFQSIQYPPSVNPFTGQPKGPWDYEKGQGKQSVRPSVVEQKARRQALFERNRVIPEDPRAPAAISGDFNSGDFLPSNHTYGGGKFGYTKEDRAISTPASKRRSATRMEMQNRSRADWMNMQANPAHYPPIHPSYYARGPLPAPIEPPLPSLERRVERMQMPPQQMDIIIDPPAPAPAPARVVLTGGRELSRYDAFEYYKKHMRDVELGKQYPKKSRFF